MNIREATSTELDQLFILFAQYAVFYEQRFEPGTSKQYLAEMLSGVESIIFIYRIIHLERKAR